MKKKNKVTLLTNAELAIMQILWCSDRPLDRSEVCAAAEKEVDTPVFNKNSFHVLINDLITKNMVVALDAAGFTNRNARRYAPTISRNEYFADCQYRALQSRRYSQHYFLSFQILQD